MPNWRMADLNRIFDGDDSAAVAHSHHSVHWLSHVSNFFIHGAHYGVDVEDGFVLPRAIEFWHPELGHRAHQHSSIRADWLLPEVIHSRRGEDDKYHL